MSLEYVFLVLASAWCLRVWVRVRMYVRAYARVSLRCVFLIDGSLTFDDFVFGEIVHGKIRFVGIMEIY